MGRLERSMLQTPLINSRTPTLRAAKFPAFDGLSREDFTSQLRNVDKGPSVIEEEFLKRWECTLTRGKWLPWILSWARGLQAYGTPLSFLNQLEQHPAAFRESGKDWSTFRRVNPNNELRRELIAKQPPYMGRVPIEVLGRYDASCKLCENLHQGVDAKKYPQHVANNIMIDFGAWVLAPNRYPPTPLAMLWIPKDHDDLSLRVPPLTVNDPNLKSREVLSPLAGKTRDALVNPKELSALFEFANTVGIVALRNHRLSGKSIHAHDHWQLLPLEVYPPHWFRDFVGPSRSSLSKEIRAHGTPFDVLVLRDFSPTALASRTAEVLNRLERDNIIFSPYFIPGNSLNRESSPMVLIAPLVESAGDSFVQIGGGVQVHEIFDGASRQKFSQYVPRRGYFPWSKFGVTSGDLSRVDTNFTQEEIFERYSPLAYSNQNTWGDGSAVLSTLTTTERRVYDALSAQQDKRGDTGHADTVIYFTQKLSDIAGLSPSEKEGATLAAIIHDAGWASISDIQVKWKELVTRLHGKDASDAGRAKEEMGALRKVHEGEASKIAIRLLAGHRHQFTVAGAVADHDTRDRLPTPLFRPFYDADWLWRSTVMSRLSDSSGEYDRGDSATVYSRLQGEFAPEDFLYPWAYYVFRLELANTMLTLNERLRWKDLPPDFLSDYSAEIQRLTGR